MKLKALLFFFETVCVVAVIYFAGSRVADTGAKPRPEIEKVSVLVPRHDLSMGWLINDPEKLFEEKQFPAAPETKKAIRSFEDLKGRRLNKPLTTSQFLTADDLLDRNMAGYFQSGRWVNLLCANVKDSGSVRPGSHVDIVWVVTKTNDETCAKIILENTLILEVDRNPTRPEASNFTVTVEVTPEQAERLALAQKMGTFRLVPPK